MYFDIAGENMAVRRSLDADNEGGFAGVLLCAGWRLAVALRAISMHRFFPWHLLHHAAGHAVTTIARVAWRTNGVEISTFLLSRDFSDADVHHRRTPVIILHVNRHLLRAFRRRL